MQRSWKIPVAAVSAASVRTPQNSETLIPQPPKQFQTAINPLDVVDVHDVRLDRIFRDRHRRCLAKHAHSIVVRSASGI
jgi:hypothetical protein